MGFWALASDAGAKLLCVKGPLREETDGGRSCCCPAGSQDPQATDPVLVKLTYRTRERLIGSKGGIRIFHFFFDFLCVCRTTNFILRFLRIHPVQNVANNPTQLSGRGFARIFHMKLFLSQLYVFVVGVPNWKPSRVIKKNKKKMRKTKTYICSPFLPISRSRVR